MKVASKLAVLLSLGALVPFASAKTIGQSYLDTCRRDPGVPVPIVVVSPRDLAADVGDQVKIEFTVDTTGKPSQFSVLSSNDADFADAVVDAVKQWQFTPAERNGLPVTTKVVLPVNVVAPSVGTGYAAE